MLPIAYARKPGRAAAARKTFRAASIQVHLAIPIEHIAPPDLLNRFVVRVGEQFGSAERDVLTAERDAPQRVYIETLEGPDTGLLLFRGQIGVEMFVQSFSCRDRRVVVPGEKLACDDLVNADIS